MNENSAVKQTSISQANTIEEIAAYWDSHSLADHWNETHEVSFTVRARRRHRIVIDPDIFSMIESRSRERGVQPETLINLWLNERLLEKA